jgi:predicted GNAT family acetyltransferase
VATESTTTISREESGGAGRFFLKRGAAVLGTLDFTRPRPGVLHIDFVEVHHQARGAGLGRQLVDAAVHWAETEKLAVVPRCSFARSVIGENHKRGPASDR